MSARCGQCGTTIGCRWPGVPSHVAALDKRPSEAGYIVAGLAMGANNASGRRET
jgi:hypothetical protein